MGSSLTDEEIKSIHDYFTTQTQSIISYINSVVDSDQVIPIHNEHLNNVCKLEEFLFNDMFTRVYTKNDDIDSNAKIGWEDRLKHLLNLWLRNTSMKNIIDWEPDDLMLMFEYAHDDDEKNLHFYANKITKRMEMNIGNLSMILREFSIVLKQ